MKAVNLSTICLAVLVLPVFQGCSLSQPADDRDPRASFNPDAFDDSEEGRAKKLAPMIDSFAQHMWLSTVKDGENSEKQRVD